MHGPFLSVREGINSQKFKLKAVREGMPAGQIFRAAARKDK